MGMVRKTLSVGTLGLVSFRSKKEKLRRAECSRRKAETALEAEHAARLQAEQRIDAAEKRVKHASTAAALAAWQLQRTRKSAKDSKGKGKRKQHSAPSMTDLRAGVEPIVRSGVEGARSGVVTAKKASVDATKRGRRAGRKARKAAKKSWGRAAATAAAGAIAAREAAQDAAKQATSHNA